MTGYYRAFRDKSEMTETQTLRMGLPYMATLGWFQESMGRQSYGSPMGRVWEREST